MKILITATGTVGSHIVRLLHNQGHELRVLVRNQARAALPTDVEVVEGDLTNPNDVRRAMEGVDRAFLNMADDNGTHFATVAGKMELGRCPAAPAYGCCVTMLI